MHRLLYLEDDEALANVTRRGLKLRGFEVHYFANITSLSLALHSGNNLTFDGALLDLKIGNTTSLELITQIKQHADVPVVVLTGYGTVRAAVQAMKLGALDFISKPCSLDEIVAAFAQAQASPKKAPLSEAEVAPPSLKQMEWETIQKALDDNDGNISAAARQLKLHRRTLQRKLLKKHIEFT